MYMHVYINLEEYSKVVFILTEVLQSLFFFFDCCYLSHIKCLQFEVNFFLLLIRLTDLFC